ncbi:paired box protein Pax-1-like, partial [Sinocyclocheilus grahami]|uniref:paired box protein Pax-1-like n=1 Tax=Sinocyclocheilus grahami TaxID=75366 RepID=UPI0007AD5C79
GSSNLSAYVPACAYSATNQYGVYGGHAGNYGHWQSQGASLTHPNTGTMIQSPNLHTAISFKNPPREAERRCPLSKQQHEGLSAVHGLSDS